jgi:hypothetical protein
VTLDGVSQTYCDAVLGLSAFKEWEAAALQETAAVALDVFQKAD